jgi:uncharacterized short protein YbdD (DUF466 family)
MPKFLSAFRTRWARVACVLRQVVGAPDYQRYVAHLRACHPSAEPLGLDEFYRVRLEERYTKPGARCC